MARSREREPPSRSLNRAHQMPGLFVEMSGRIKVQAKFLQGSWEFRADSTKSADKTSRIRTVRRSVVFMQEIHLICD